MGNDGGVLRRLQLLENISRLGAIQWLWRDGVGDQWTGDGLDRGALQVQVGCVIGHLVRPGVMQEQNATRERFQGFTGLLVLGAAIEDGGRSGHAELTINPFAPTAERREPRTGGCEWTEKIKNKLT